jgi:hypothetical protein
MLQLVGSFLQYLTPCRQAKAYRTLTMARDALVNSTSEVLNYSGSEKRNVAINDC